MMIHVSVNKLKKKLISLNKPIIKVLKKQGNLQVEAALFFLVVFALKGIHMKHLNGIKSFCLACSTI